ncbi:MAG: aldehyde dehydrogenase family protein [Pirellulaceae bacterium]|nr:aldehyde dehydrogenase family protein [Pirellulaceae bacterium]
MKMFVHGQWVDGQQRIDVVHPFDGSVVDTVPAATPADAERALSGAAAGAALMRDLPAYTRSQILRQAAQRMAAREEELARTITLEEGKTLAEARTEARRAAETMELAAEEAKRLYGEVLPLDGASAGAGKLGFTLRVPCGVVLAITPFNFPLNLVCHKVGPALAAGNAVIVKPASDTPLSALKLTEILLESGLPPLAIQCLTGSGDALGRQLCGDHRVRKISFTGSADVGRRICELAGIKRVTMELGSNSPLIVMPDADLEQVAAATVATGYSNAGQVCISAQRVIALGPIYESLLDQLRPRVAQLPTGNPLDPEIRMGPMIRQRDAERVGQWVEEAVAGGARLLCGGQRSGNLFQPTLLADVHPDMRVSCEELFGPAVAVTRATDIEEAIRLANSTRYGLSAAIFTRDLNHALQFARHVHSGNLQINWGPAWRADLMPYGGLGDSGLGKEGPKYAVEEMTELKTVIIHGLH